MLRTIDFFFDFMSPYAYLAHHRLLELARRWDLELAYHPIDLARAKLAVGNTAPPNREMPIKHRYLRTDLKRWADLYRVAFVPPAAGDPAFVNRGAFYAIDRDCAESYVTLAWHRIWGQGTPMDSSALLAELARSLGWDAQDFERYVRSDAAVQRLQASNDAATSRGVFGVPTMAIGEELWWGNDRLDFLESHIRHQLTTTPATR